MIRKDWNFCDQFLQTAAVLDRATLDKILSTLIFQSAVNFQQYQIYYFLSNI